MMGALFHAKAVLPPSWSAKTNNVEAASNRTAPNQSTCWKDLKEMLGFLYVFSFCGQQASMIATPTAAAGALNRYIQRHEAFSVIVPPRTGPVARQNHSTGEDRRAIPNTEPVARTPPIMPLSAPQYWTGVISTPMTISMEYKPEPPIP